ncbi:TetR/AcrR family transcriptional regulator [Cryptosporangium aurantiacum]|uniref:Transcriptional regulator, TetR family n=1 Tax=Cryptosporangium aurantiacum TaxID=134849 RepID=A0A1M7RAT1_9ACTN|nr:TetR/AcrR family transcriptional regulator [Cryptosporangium aurantiacum]SHN43394.1 transcriptional regulator, TetR family [Cryptosporangium aurantiacum]
MTPTTPDRILTAARGCLLADGYSGFSTRRVAEAAGVPLSQIHYHFGTRKALVLALLERENQTLLERQRRMYGTEAPLWKRYEQACDYLDDDLASGYVRVLQEMIAAGWSDETLAAQVLTVLQGWYDVLGEVAREAERRFGSLGPFTADQVAGLVAMAFLGGESLALLGDPKWSDGVRGWLRSVTDLIRSLEEG